MMSISVPVPVYLTCQNYISSMRNNYITQLMQHLVIFVHDDLICVFIEATHQKRNRILPRLWDECRYDLDDFC